MQKKLSKRRDKSMLHGEENDQVCKVIYPLKRFFARSYVSDSLNNNLLQSIIKMHTETVEGLGGEGVGVGEGVDGSLKDKLILNIV